MGASRYRIDRPQIYESHLYIEAISSNMSKGNVLLHYNLGLIRTISPAQSYQ